MWKRFGSSLTKAWRDGPATLFVRLISVQVRRLQRPFPFETPRYKGMKAAVGSAFLRSGSAMSG
jgi:hypothetical protein